MVNSDSSTLIDDNNKKQIFRDTGTGFLIRYKNPFPNIKVSVKEDNDTNWQQKPSDAPTAMLEISFNLQGKNRIWTAEKENATVHEFKDIYDGNATKYLIEEMANTAA